MQISPFVSLCKYGFWSHERTHSIISSFSIQSKCFFFFFVVKSCSLWPAVFTKITQQYLLNISLLYFLSQMNVRPSMEMPMPGDTAAKSLIS